MISLVKIISTSIDNLNRRLPKFLRLGIKDIQTSLEVGPYGVDANPIKDMIAVYIKTGEKGKTVIVGYINKRQLAAPGEHRIFSTNANGTLKAYAWLRADGSLEINGDDDNMVRFSELKTGFDKLKSDLNAFLTHVHGASGTPPAPPAPPSTASIDNSKINEVKTLS